MQVTNGIPRIRVAAAGDAALVWSILSEAAAWQAAKGTQVWLAGELDEAQVAADVAAGLYRIAEVGGEAAGTIKVQDADPLFWPDKPGTDSVYVHRLAVRRRFSGGAVAAALLGAGTAAAAALRRPFVRLDCPADRPRLRAVYERYGFRHHSNRQVGPYFVSRYELAVRPRSLLLPLAAALVVAAGLCLIAMASRPYSWSGPAVGEPYNLVADGFRAGHLWIARDAPPALAKEPNPYAFATYRPYLRPPWSLTDLSYYKGRLYAYFGVTPAVLLFWPFRAVAGRPLHQAYGVLLFSLAGFGIMAALAASAWRRYFAQVRPWEAAAAVVLLGSATTLPLLLTRPGTYEVSISCGFALAMASLYALWRAWHSEGRAAAWTAAASLAFGLAVGSRPTLLFGAAILLLPVAGAFRSGRPWTRLALAAVLPIAAVGAGLAAYNFGRFGDPLQFGHEYQLSGNNVYATSSFAPRFLWDNVRLYFLEPLRWHARFPFVWSPPTPQLAQDHLPVEFFFGVIPAFPILLAALLAPRARRLGAGPALAALVVLFGASCLPICFYAGATSRYFVDFMPALVLLAVAGYWSCAGRSGLRAVSAVALVFSVATAWCLAAAVTLFYRGAERGAQLLAAGQIREAAAVYDRVTAINPAFRAQAEMALGTSLVSGGRVADGITLLRAATHEDSHLGAAFFNLGRAYLGVRQLDEAAAAFGKAAALDPFDGEAEAALGVVLFNQGKTAEAADHERAALRIEPTLAQARLNLLLFEKAGH